MQRIVLNVGDNAWIYGEGHKGKLSKHKVVHVFELNNERMYVIEIDTPVESCYAVRDGFSVSDKKKLNIGLWRKS